MRIPDGRVCPGSGSGRRGPCRRHNCPVPCTDIVGQDIDDIRLLTESLFQIREFLPDQTIVGFPLRSELLFHADEFGVVDDLRSWPVQPYSGTWPWRATPASAVRVKYLIASSFHLDQLQGSLFAFSKKVSYKHILKKFWRQVKFSYKVFLQHKLTDFPPYETISPNQDSERKTDLAAAREPAGALRDSDQTALAAMPPGGFVG